MCFMGWLVLLLGTSSLYAQITYQANDYAEVGDQFLVSEAGPNLLVNDYQQTGANVAWDFSELTVRTQDSVQVQNPRDAGYYLSWLAICALSGGNPLICPSRFDQLTNQAVSSTDTISLGGFTFAGGTTHYLKSTNALSISLTGFSTEVSGTPVAVTTEYQSPDVVYHFPLQYQRIDSNSFRQALTIPGTDLGRTLGGQRKVAVDGHGSLVTPYKTYPDVLRVRTLISQIDSLFTGTDTVAIPSSRVIYQWFSKADRWPVFEASGVMLAGIETINTVRFLDTARCLAPLASFFYLPLLPRLDSISGEVTVAFDNQTNNGTTYNWDFGDGSSDSGFEVSHVYNSSGTFTVTLVACNFACADSACDTSRLPIFVQAAPMSTGLSPSQLFGVEYYPNPAYDRLTLMREARDPLSVEIFDLEGRRLDQLVWQGTEAQLSLENLPKGLYILRLSSPSGVQSVEKFMKR